MNLPWKIRKEKMNQLSTIGNLDGRYIVPIPEVVLCVASGIKIEDTV